MESVDCVVAGAGVVGLAVARALGDAGREVLLLEAADAIGSGISSRNSEVIHAGLYYASGSLKGRLCVAGREPLYAWCAERGVAHRRLGKLIVATDAAQHGALERLAAQARANGVEDLRWLDAREARALEPALVCREALLSPSTGIIDSHGLMLSLLGAAEDRGALLALRSPLVRARVLAGGGFELDVGGPAPTRLRARTLVNCAGLDAPALAASIDGLPREHVPRGRLCKGNYFRCAGRPAFSRLVYPLPEGAGLGVHLTLDLAGQMRFGPDVQWIERIDHDVDASRADVFYAAIRRWWPALPDGALAPDYAGIRPKLGGPEEPARDFLIEGPREHGIEGLVNLFGIESPGLTACLAIGAHVGEATMSA
jgi:L-2-hydroxyglutarate oxidase LhgO